MPVPPTSPQAKADTQRLQVKMEELKRQEEEFKKKEDELSKKERVRMKLSDPLMNEVSLWNVSLLQLTPWNVDTLSKDGFEKTVSISSVTFTECYK